MDHVGVFGGTFDPIHLGHLIPAEYACNHFRLKRLLLVPSAAPVHRPRHNPASGQHRLRMCRLAAASLGPFEVSDVEVSRSEPSYTIITLRYLAETLGPGVKLVLLVGEDNLPTVHTWRRIDEILDLATVAILPRPVSGPLDLGPAEAALGRDTVQAILGRTVPAPRVPISASDIRSRVAEGKPIAGLVPASVARYIAETGIYSDSACRDHASAF